MSEHEQRAREIVDGCTVPAEPHENEIDLDEKWRAELTKRITHALTDAVAQEREQNCHAVCFACAHPELWHPSKAEGRLWLHTNTTYEPGKAMCSAQSIRQRQEEQHE